AWVVVRRRALSRDGRAGAGEPENLLAGAALAHEPHRQQCVDRGRRQQRLHRALEIPHDRVPPRGAAAIRRHRRPSLGAERRAYPHRFETREPAQLRRAPRRHRRSVLTYDSGPAYLPAVAGKSNFTILNLEMSTVASMCMKMAASRKIFSTPKSSITPLPPCSSRQCWATFKISSDA